MEVCKICGALLLDGSWVIIGCIQNTIANIAKLKLKKIRLGGEPEAKRSQIVASNDAKY